MKVNAKLKNLRIAPRKVRLVVETIKGKNLDEARDILSFTVKKCAKPLLKLLNSAAANAENNFQLKPSNLYISKLTVDEGPKYKRWMPRAMGRATEIHKKTSHINIVLDEIEEGKRVKKSKKGKSGTKNKIKKEKDFKKNPKKELEDKIKKPQIRKGGSQVFRRKSI
jgi:large subunit ribosomal protein L22